MVLMLGYSYPEEQVAQKPGLGLNVDCPLAPRPDFERFLDGLPAKRFFFVGDMLRHSSLVFWVLQMW